MKAELFRRLERLEKAVNQTTVPRLVLVDVTDFADDQRERYWSGDDSVLGLPDDTGGGIHAVVIDLNPACRKSWLHTRDMSDEDVERYEERRWREEEQAQQIRGVTEVQKEPEPQFDKYGYR